MSYQTEYQASITDPITFWADKARAIPWLKPPLTILSQDENGMDRWFADGELNTAYIALDFHIEQGRGDQPALIYDSPVSNSRKTFSYRQLRDEVARFAGALRANGVDKGDRVVIYMPMIPEAVIAMLAVARLGAIHSVVFGGFAPHELAARIEDAEPKVVVSASCGIEFANVIAYKPLIDAAIAQSGFKPARCIIVQRPQLTAALIGGRDIDWQAAMQAATPVDYVAIRSTDPLYILYTSGTTGKPKGVVRDNGSHAVAMKYSMKAVYNIDCGDVFWAASDVGWVVGHSYIVYAPLIAGATTVMYEGKPIKTPDASAFWRICAEYKVKALFAAPTAFRAIRKEDPQSRLLQGHDLSALKTVFVAGERLDPPTYHWIKDTLGKPVVDHWWQTETGWAICGNLTGVELMESKPGSSTLPTPGFNVQVLDDEGLPCPVGTHGNIVVRRPLPPSCLPSIWGNFERFHNDYLKAFPGYYLTGDGGYIDADGYVFIMGRIDDVINVAGHRLSTGEMEEVLTGHPAVAECCVIGVHDELKGQLPVGLVLLKNDANISPEQLETELVERIRTTIGAVASFKRALTVPRLPKTRSGKI
jgi:propionyl-CoA synthetase